MSVHGCNKPWYTCNGFQEEHPIQPVFLSNNILLPREYLFVPTHDIKAKTQGLDKEICELISNVCRMQVGDIYFFDFIFVPNGMWHCAFVMFLETLIRVQRCLLLLL